MKRFFAFLLTAALALCCAACMAAEPAAEMVQPVRFYYGDISQNHDGPDGALGWELRDLGPETLSLEEILELYRQGPQSDTLRMLLPPQVRLEKSWLRDGVLSLTLSDGLSALSGAERTAAVAGLVYTMSQFQDVDSVWLTSSDGALTELFSQPLTTSDFLLFDDSATNDDILVKLYFSDVNGRYLTQETRTRSFASESELPGYIIQQLLLGPKEKGSLASLPEGTTLLNIRVQDDLCVVDFSRSFVENAPHTHGQARMTVFSLVNSLTELPQIQRVRILCGGRLISDYAGLDLTRALTREESAIAQPPKSGAYDATLYLPCEEGNQLAEVPKVIRRTTGRTLTEDLLTALQGYDGSNGYVSPIPQGALAVDVVHRGSTCRVTYNSAFAMCDEDPRQALLAVRAVVATLCAQDSVDQVELKIYNETLDSVDISKPLSPSPDWFLP